MQSPAVAAFKPTAARSQGRLAARQCARRHAAAPRRSRGHALHVLSFRDSEAPIKQKTPQQQGGVATATREEPPHQAAAPDRQQARARTQRRVVQLRAEEHPSIVALDVGNTVLGVILGGGSGEKLWPLTSRRAKPAVPVGANYRLIDISVSNCLNSGLHQVYCLTQHNSASLNRHLQQVYQQTSRNQLGNNGFVEALPASPTTFASKWAQGSADAVKLQMWVFEEAVKRGVQDFLIMSGDHLYRMDYRFLLRAHRQTDADITIAALPADAPHAPDLGLLKVDSADNWRVTEFMEKPGIEGEALGSMSVDTADLFGLDDEDAHERPFIASMGVYAIKASVLKELLTQRCRECRDFGSEVIPAAQEAGLRLHAFPYNGYWRNLSTVAEYYSANMELIATNGRRGAAPKFDLYNQRAPLLTLPMLLPPSKVGDADLSGVLLGDGTQVRRGSRISRSVLGVRSVVGKHCVIEDSVLLGADYYETKRDLELSGEGVAMGIGDGCSIRKAIIDKNARVGKGCVLVNKAGIREGGDEKRGWVVVDGITVVLKNATLQPGTVV